MAALRGIHCLFGSIRGNKEFPLEKLFAIAQFYQHHFDPLMEVIYFNTSPICLHSSVLLGIDVALIGGESLLANDKFVISRNENYPWDKERIRLVNKLNKYGLFESLDDAHALSNLTHSFLTTKITLNLASGFHIMCLRC
jgi:hypothetical protein